MKAAQPYTPLSEIPADLVSVTDYARRAPEHMPHAIYEYIAGGGADEVTLRHNREALDRWQILPRVLADVTGGGTQTELLGQQLRHPIALAPVAFHRLVHPQAEIATARAASACRASSARRACRAPA